MVEGGLNIIDNAGGKLVDKAVINIARHMVGATEIGHDAHFWAVGGQIDRIGLNESGAPILADGGCLTDLQCVAANIGAVFFQKIGPVVADNRKTSRLAAIQGLQTAKAHRPPLADDRPTAPVTLIFDRLMSIGQIVVFGQALILCAFAAGRLDVKILKSTRCRTDDPRIYAERGRQNG